MARKNPPRQPRTTPEQLVAARGLREDAARAKAAQRAEIRRLKGQGLDVVTDRDGSILRAQRLDVVQMLINSKRLSAQQADAYRKLETMLEAASSSPKSCLSSLDRVNGGGDSSAQEQRRLDATKDLVKLERKLSAGDWGFLRELAEGGGLLTRWRRVAMRWTGRPDDGDLILTVLQVIVKLEVAQPKPPHPSRSNYIGDMIGRAEEVA